MSSEKRRGLWPGVAAVVGDAALWCLPCADERYGGEVVEALVRGEECEGLVDDEGNPLGVVLVGSEDLHGQYCDCCWEPLCDEECVCYRKGDADGDVS
ncbi:hypothetical protein KTAU_13880 [Thermogemmatispora aurantia]|uniref:Uncharacterized protein n=2 Tax=Thermogemmatispora aurantia TaxID=2045279 RepID=A0A5J4K7U7_9CHLR|nr:hypothetical protein KTAU_13880 [Thermogemmatispora aurantia]